MVIGVLALQGDFAAHAAVLGRLGCEWRWVRSAEELDGIDGLILPGGESTTMLKFLDDRGFWGALQSFVRERPAFGTCAGAILLAREVRGPAQASLGAIDVTLVRNGYGRQIDSSIRQARVEAEYAGALGAEQLETVLIRAPRFQELGPGVEVVATAGDEPVLLRQGRVLVSSFHPELSPEPHVHRWFLQLVQSG